MLATLGDEAISLGVGEPDFRTPAHIVAAGIRALQNGRTCYTANAGTLELRKAVAAHLGRIYGVSYEPESEIIITAGVSEAMMIAMLAIVDPGDEVVVAEPCFPFYVPDVIFAGGKPVLVATREEDGFVVSPERIEAAITSRTKAILLGYPNNPTGAVLPREVMAAIAEIAQRHGVAIISDEIYDRLVYGVEHVCFAALAPEQVILLGGFSKDYAMTGWRVGYACAREPLAEAMLRIHECLLMCVAQAAQDAAVEALLHGEPEVQRMVQAYDRRRKVISQGLNEIGLPTVEPRGAFYTFSRVSHLGLNDVGFAERLLREEKVAVIPGSAFGPSGVGYVRAAYVQELDVLETALDRIERMVRRLR